MECNLLPMHQLPPGKRARVKTMNCRGNTRRRMLDLGIIHGTEIELLMRSPSGDPSAYFIRGAVIALRADVASLIMVGISM
ncbi:MAG: ferrous iron transport protein A [Firmicutes bacterium]|nr:ferrous iron transport protein A [Bacillota bacterium]